MSFRYRADRFEQLIRALEPGDVSGQARETHER
jgi:hypothetical protein